MAVLKSFLRCGGGFRGQIASWFVFGFVRGIAAITAVGGRYGARSTALQELKRYGTAFCTVDRTPWTAVVTKLALSEETARAASSDNWPLTTSRYLVLPPSIFNSALAPACAAASRAVSTRNGEHET